jgi:hypothetical protein
MWATLLITAAFTLILGIWQWPLMADISQAVTTLASAAVK